jgi:hypothetical protein
MNPPARDVGASLSDLGAEMALNGSTGMILAD